jgi:hypothetical protein
MDDAAKPTSVIQNQQTKVLQPLEASQKRRCNEIILSLTASVGTPTFGNNAYKGEI